MKISLYDRIIAEAFKKTFYDLIINAVSVIKRVWDEAVPILTIALCIIGDVSWDWVNQKLYWSDPCQSDIEVYDPNTRFRKVLFNSTNGLRNPAGLIVDPTTRYIDALGIILQ